MNRIAFIAACALICLGLFGCADGAGAPAPTLAPATPAPTSELTPQPTSEPTPEPLPGLALSGDGDSAGSVISAVVGDYYVYLKDQNLYSRPYGDPLAQPVLLQADTIPFHVWNGYAVVYAKPDERTPYRSILVKPDGSERRVIDERQRSFYNVITGVGDYLYAYPGAYRGMLGAYEGMDLLVRYSLSGNRVEKLFPVEGQGVCVMDGFYYAMDDYNSDQSRYRTLDDQKRTLWRYDLATGERVPVFHDAGGFFAVAAEGFICIATQQTLYALLPDGTIRKVLEGPLLSTYPEVLFTQGFVTGVYQDKDALYADAPINLYYVTAQGLYPVVGIQPVGAFYPMDSGEGSFYVQAGPQGEAYLVGVDAAGFIPMEEFPLYE